MDKRKFLLRIFCIFIATITFVSSLIFSLNKKSNSTLSPPLSFSILIDAGHGGIDGGAIGIKTGNKESDLNLDLSLILKKYLSSASLSTTMTRENQYGLYDDATVVAIKNFQSDNGIYVSGAVGGVTDRKSVV